MNIKKQTSKRGFTIVEVLIIAPIVILVIGIFITAIVSMTGDVLATRASNNLAYSIQDALNRIEQDVKSSGGYLATNNIPLTSPQGYSDDTTKFHNADTTYGTMLILNSYTNTSNPLTSTGSIAYTSGQPYACNNALVYKNPPAMMNTIYFVKDNTLWRRVVAPANYETVGCVGTSVGAPWQQPSCSPDISDPFCKTQDIRLVDGVDPTAGFVVNYYTTPDSSTAITTASDSSQIDIVRLSALKTATATSITINATSSVAGRDVAQTGTIRATSLNNNTLATTKLTCPSGFIVVPGSSTYGTNDFCVMKYEAKQASATVPISQATGLPWISIAQAGAVSAITYAPNVAGCTGCHLITEAEWLTIAQNVLSVSSNWSGGVVGVGYIYSGHNDNAPASALAADTNDDNGYSGETNAGGNQRRTLTLSNGEVIWDFAGNVWEWTNTTIAGGLQPGLAGEVAYAWKQWNNSSLLINGLPTSAMPGYNTITGASSWNSSQGIGQLYSNYGEAGIRAFRRGGDWSSAGYDGVYALMLSGGTTSTSASGGFRVSK